MTLKSAPKGLLNYLENELSAADASREIWADELEAFRQLGDLFSELDMYSRPTEGHLTNHQQIFHILLFTVQHQMFSVVSQLLRTNKNDAFSLTRRAIEATAIAHKIYVNESLLDVFLTAYPHIADDTHPKQWLPGNKYEKKFKSKELFSQSDPILERLGKIYETICATALPAGPSVLVTLTSANGKTFFVANEADPNELDRCWAWLLVTYFDSLRVFLKVLGKDLLPAVRQVFENKINKCLTEAKSKMKHRPWENVAEDPKKAKEI